MLNGSRIASADLSKGIILIIMLFLVDFHPGILGRWFDGSLPRSGESLIFTLIISSLFFMSGVTIPFRLSEKSNRGESTYDMVKSVFALSLIMITAGVMLANISRVDSELTGFGAGLWSLILVVAIFLVWNRYPDREGNFFTVSGLRVAGLAMLAFLVFKFRSGSWENNGSLITGYWELPGLYGWGFMAASFTWLALRNSVTGALTSWFIFLALTIFSSQGFYTFPGPVMEYLGVFLDGFVPLLFVSGLLAGTIIKKSPSSEFRKLSVIFAIAGVMFSAAGTASLRVLSSEGFYGKPSWALITLGFSLLLFALLFFFYEPNVNRFRLKTAENAGSSFFTAYITAFLIKGIADLSAPELTAFRDSASLAVQIAGSAAFSIVVTGLALLASRAEVRLKF